MCFHELKHTNLVKDKTDEQYNVVGKLIDTKNGDTLKSILFGKKMKFVLLLFCCFSLLYCLFLFASEKCLWDNSDCTSYPVDQMYDYQTKQVWIKIKVLLTLQPRHSGVNLTFLNYLNTLLPPVPGLPHQQGVVFAV